MYIHISIMYVRFKIKLVTIFIEAGHNANMLLKIWSSPPGEVSQLTVDYS